MASGRGASARSGDRPARRVPVVEVSDEVGVVPAVSMLAIEYRPVGGLAVYARNARMHDARQLSQIAASMWEWGWTNPVLVEPDGGLITGHPYPPRAGPIRP